MTCWRCKHEMPDGIKYCGNCGVRMNRVAYAFEWLFSKKGLPVLLVILALIVGGLAWWIVPKLTVPDINIDFDLDMGLYTPSDDDIVFKDDEQSYGYVSNMILIFFTKDATPERIGEIVASVEGEVVGIMPGVNQYQVRVTTRTEEDLEELRKKLMEYDEVKNAVIDYVATIESETAAVPNDPWNDPSGQNEEVYWNEETPSGANWWVEAARVLSAWEYADSFTHMTVGIADNGFDISHEDLNITVLNAELNSVESHGTHVAGIIGAIHNNDLGITGVLSDVTLYGADCFATDEQDRLRIPVSSLLGGIDLCLSSGCRVVNMSAGLDPDYVSSHPEYVRENARSTVEYLIMMLDYAEDDFLIVKSAGNAGSDAHGINGYFCSIDEELVREVLDQMAADGVKLEKDITVDDVMNSFIVVGAVDYEKNGENYQLATFSNYGDAVTVCAPGVHILSTVPTGNAYDYKNGTSMAAPVVTGITAMVWSVDPAMTAAQVKDIIVSSATETVLARNGGDSGTYYLVDAAAAVEMALDIKASHPTDPSEEPTTEPSTDPTTEPTEEPTDSTEPAYTGTPYLPDIEEFLGKYNFSHYEPSRRVTDGTNSDASGPWLMLSVDDSMEEHVYAYMSLLMEEYHFDLVGDDNGEYLFRFSGTQAPDMFYNAKTEISYHVRLVLSRLDEDNLLIDFLYEEGLELVDVDAYIGEEDTCFWFYDYAIGEYQESNVSTYQEITGVTCQLSALTWAFLDDDFEDMVLGYDPYYGVFLYEYDEESLNAYKAYLETLNFEPYLTEEYVEGVSYYYYQEATGFYLDLFVANNDAYLVVEPYLNAEPD